MQSSKITMIADKSNLSRPYEHAEVDGKKAFEQWCERTPDFTSVTEFFLTFLNTNKHILILNVESFKRGLHK